MGELIDDMVASGDIEEMYDLLPLILAKAVLWDLLSPAEAQEWLAVAETAGWHLLKLCKVLGHWMILACVLQSLTGSLNLSHHLFLNSHSNSSTLKPPMCCAMPLTDASSTRRRRRPPRAASSPSSSRSPICARSRRAHSAAPR